MYTTEGKYINHGTKIESLRKKSFCKWREIEGKKRRFIKTEKIATKENRSPLYSRDFHP